MGRTEGVPGNTFGVAAAKIQHPVRIYFPIKSVSEWSRGTSSLACPSGGNSEYLAGDEANRLPVGWLLAEPVLGAPGRG